MIGHNQIVERRLKGYAPTDVYLHIKPHPPKRDDGFWNAEETLSNRESPYPDVYVGDNDPRRADLSWAYKLNIHLLPSPTTTNEEYCDWWVACVEANPKFLVGIDPDGEVNVWKS